MKYWGRWVLSIRGGSSMTDISPKEMTCGIGCMPAGSVRADVLRHCCTEHAPVTPFKWQHSDPGYTLLNQPIKSLLSPVCRWHFACMCVSTLQLFFKFLLTPGCRWPQSSTFPFLSFVKECRWAPIYILWFPWTFIYESGRGVFLKRGHSQRRIQDVICKWPSASIICGEKSSAAATTPNTRETEGANTFCPGMGSEPPPPSLPLLARSLHAFSLSLLWKAFWHR